MKQIEINLGKACNNNCVFCANGTIPAAQRRFLPIEIVEAEIVRAAEQGYRALGFLGGEATIYPGFTRVLKRARKAGFERICLTTNGRRLKDPRRLERLVQAGVTRITLSIHSHLAEVENRICGRKNAFEEKIQAIQNVVEATTKGRFRLSDGFALNSCIHGQNVHRLAGQAAFFRALGTTDIRFNFVMPEHRAANDPEWIPTIAELGPALEHLVSWNENTDRMHLTISDVPLCGYPEHLRTNRDLFGRYLGEARDLDTFVVMYGGADCTKDHFRWKDRRTNLLKEHPQCCRKCHGLSVCEGIWKKYLELHGDSDLAPIA